MGEDYSEYIVSFKNGDFKNFDKFYSLIKYKVFYNILSVIKNYDTSEDLLQETFIKFLDVIKKVDPKGNILGLLMTISRNVSLDYLRKHSRANLVEYDDHVNNSYTINNNNTVSQSNTDVLINKIKNIIKPKEFEIFILHIIDDLTFKEISKLVNKPLGTILWMYQEALKKVRKELKNEL